MRKTVQSKLDALWNGPDGVLAKGTRFFGKPLWEMHYVEARTKADSLTRPLLERAKNLGADESFFRACIFYLTELCVKHGQSEADFVKFEERPWSKEKQRVQVSARLEGIYAIRALYDEVNGLLLSAPDADDAQIAALRKRWDNAKGQANEDTDAIPREKKVDEAFSRNCLPDIERCLKEFLLIDGLEDYSGRPRGRPGLPDPLLYTLSGLDKYLESCTRITKVQRLDLLAEIVSALTSFLDFDISCSANNFKTLISAYRKENQSNGVAELKHLKAEWTRLLSLFSSA
jgi:hypothetical protein